MAGPSIDPPQPGPPATGLRIWEAELELETAPPPRPTLSAAGSELVWPMPSESAENRFKSDDDDWKNDNGSGFYRAAPELYAHDDGAASLNASVY